MYTVSSLDKVVNMNEKNLIKFITFAPIIIIPAVVAIIFYINIVRSEELFQNSTKNLKEELISKEKSNTVSKVKMAVEILNYENSSIKERLKQKIKERVERAFTIGSKIYEQNIETRSEREVKKIITDVLRTMVWNDGESFIFILDKNGVFALAPEYLRDLEGKSIINFQDTTGRYVIQEEIAVVNAEEEGFLWDTFTRPNRDPNTQYQQMAFVKDFKIFNWYLGSAEYLDTTKEEIEQNALALLRNINKNGNDYFFIYDLMGNIVLHSQNPELEGKNFLHSQNKEYAAIAKQMVENIQKKGESFLTYMWQNPKNSLVEEKVSYFEKIPNTNWMIGSGFYAQEINDLADAKKKELENLNKGELNLMKIYALIFIAISIFAAFYISKNLQNRFLRLKKDLDIKTNELQSLNEALEEKIKQRTLELTNAYEKMHKLANTDSLTQISNRYSFLNEFNALLKNYKESHSGFSLLMIDIDHFKKINDTHGHDIGDFVIIEVTKLIKSCLRESDIFGRVGGEEFMILLPNTNIDSAQELAQRMRKVIDEHYFEAIKHITVSVGVIASNKNESGVDMLKRVDVALYKAKNEGRNRVCTVQTA